MTIEVVKLRIGDRQTLRTRWERSEPTLRPTLFRMQTLTGRSLEREIMDTPASDSEVYSRADCNAALHSLNRLHRFLFYNGAFYSHLRRAAPRDVLEIGCGGGYLAHAVARQLPDARVRAVDRNAEAVDFCQQNIPALPNLSFECVDDTASEEVDVVYVHDVAHHMDDDELTGFIRAQYARVRHSLVIVDLHRHWLASVLWYAWRAEIQQNSCDAAGMCRRFCCAIGWRAPTAFRRSARRSSATS